jgi:hypothetical protein
MNREPSPASPEASESKALPFTIPPMIQEANDAFDRDLPELLRTHENKWVAYRGSQRIGFGKTKTELYQRCLNDGIPENELLVRCVEPFEDEEFMGMAEMDILTD